LGADALIALAESPRLLRVVASAELTASATILGVVRVRNGTAEPEPHKVAVVGPPSKYWRTSLQQGLVAQLQEDALCKRNRQKFGKRASSCNSLC
jgi:hypothetical protein